MKRFLTAHVSALLLVLVTMTAASADPIPPASLSWTYSFTPVTRTGGAPLAAVFADPQPGGGVSGVNFTRTDLSSPLPHSNSKNTDVVATQLSVFSAAPLSSPQSLTYNGNATDSGAYALQMTVSTVDGSHTVTINGGLYTLQGADEGFSSESANIKNVFDPGTQVQSFDIGQYTFTVSIGSYSQPGPPSDPFFGSISAHVSVSTVSPGQIPSPEPGTMVLSCLGLSVAGGAAWRKRRQARLAQAQ